MTSYQYRSDIQEQDQDYFVIYEEGSNDFIFQYFMQQDKVDVQNQIDPTDNKKITKELLKTDQTMKNNIEINKKQENFCIQMATDPLNTDEIINSYIQFTQGSIKNQNLTKISQLSSTSQIPSECLNYDLKFKRIKRKYQRRNLNNKNNRLNMNRDSEQTSLENKNAQQSRKRAQSNRKGKYSQSKTQKFIHFMTQYHYSKNFNQYFKKKIIEKVQNVVIYESLNPQSKVEVINSIIPELQLYQMSIHYNVQKNLHLQKNSIEQLKLLKAFFHQIIRKTYRIKFQLLKKSLISKVTSQNKKHRKFFDEKAQQEFNSIFQVTLKQEPFLSGLQISFFECIFEQD